MNGTGVSNAGLPNGTARAHSGCDIKTVNTKTLGYDCDTVGGHSGGPTCRIFGSGPTRFRQIVAVHAGTNWPNNRGSRVVHWRPVILAGQTILSVNAGESVP